MSRRSGRPRPLLLASGTLVHGYRIVRYLGHGWEGIAYRAVEQLTGAVRVLKVYEVSNSREFDYVCHVARSFERLAASGAVARYHHMGEYRSIAARHYAYLVLDHIPGPPLARLLTRKRTWGRRTACAIGLRLWSRLAAAHRLGRAIGDFEGGNNIVVAPGAWPLFCDIEAGTPTSPNTRYKQDVLLLAALIHRLGRHARCVELVHLGSQLARYRRGTVRRNTLSAELAHNGLDEILE